METDGTEPILKAKTRQIVIFDTGRNASYEMLAGEKLVPLTTSVHSRRPQVDRTCMSQQNAAAPLMCGAFSGYIEWIEWPV